MLAKPLRLTESRSASAPTGLYPKAATLAAAQSDPDGFVSGLPERGILDEVQRVPQLDGTSMPCRWARFGSLKQS
jgi:hypothetical protein